MSSVVFPDPPCVPPTESARSCRQSESRTAPGRPLAHGNTAALALAGLTLLNQH